MFLSPFSDFLTSCTAGNFTKNKTYFYIYILIAFFKNLEMNSNFTIPASN